MASAITSSATLYVIRILKRCFKPFYPSIQSQLKFYCTVNVAIANSVHVAKQKIHKHSL